MAVYYRVLLASVLLAGCSAVKPASFSSTEPAVTRASDQVWAAHERGDALGLASMVTEDAILMVPGYPDVRGRTGIQEAAQQMFASTRITNFKVERREIRVVDDSAYELAWYSETLQGQDGSSTPVQGRYLIVWKRGRDGNWRVHRNLFNLASGSHP